MKKTADYAKLVKFSHTLFAMPFAAVGFSFAVFSGQTDGEQWWWTLLKVVLCMVFARNAAMGFNRWADWRIDKDNPRTANREIPAGVISPKAALRFVVINAVLFVITASTINLLTALLSPVALLVVFSYSYCKRFTSLAHVVLGLSLAIAPVGAYISVAGRFALPPIILAAAVAFWCAGFDVLYALQDADFDRKRGLHSIPSRFSARVSLVISAAMHVVAVAALGWFCTYLPQGVLTWVGFGLFAAILFGEHIIVTPHKERNIGMAFGTFNALASVLFAVFAICAMIVG